MNVGFDVLTAVLMKNTVFWDIMPCSPLKINGRFGGIYHLHLQGSNKPNKIPASKQVAIRLATCFHAGILFGLFDPEDGVHIYF
jgi:hypothetical protein